MPTTIQESHAAGYWLGYGACALAGCFWGTGFYFGKIVLADMGVGHMVFYRFVFACVGLLPFALRHRPRLNRREWRLLLIASFFGIPVQYLVQFYGLSLTTVSHASLMVGSMPVLLGAAATLFTGERLDRVGWLALVSSTIGVVLIVLSRHQSAGWQGPFARRRSARTGCAAGLALLDPDEQAAHGAPSARRHHGLWRLFRRAHDGRLGVVAGRVAARSRGTGRSVAGFRRQRTLLHRRARSCFGTGASITCRRRAPRCSSTSSPCSAPSSASNCSATASVHRHG